MRIESDPALVRPSSIVLEITESGLARELAKALDILTGCGSSACNWRSTISARVIP
jgi:hypothetical protein